MTQYEQYVSLLFYLSQLKTWKNLKLYGQVDRFVLNPVNVNYCTEQEEALNKFLLLK